MDKDGELVKYMSSLPSYLERGINIHEGAFNIGVLDWGNLERWQHKQKIKLQRPRGPSTSRGELSSSFWNDGLPSNPTGHGHTQVHEKILELKPHTASSKDLHEVKSLGQNRQHNIQGLDRALEKHGQGDAEARRRNCLDYRTSGKNEVFPSIRSDGLACPPKAKIKVRGSAKGKRINKSEESSHSVEKELTRRPNGVVVPSARGAQNDLSERSASSTDISRTGLEDASPRSFMEKHRDSGPSACISGNHVVEAAPASRSSGTSKSKDMRRCQSSPHRSSLYPTSEPEENFQLQHIEPLPQSSVSVDNVCKPSNSPRIWSSRLKCCRSVDVSDSQLGKSEMSAGQALLQVAIKNGRPLFTFALNAESDILAASTKKLGGASRKSGSKWSYTLFKIPAVKRAKASKMKGGKIGPHHGYPIMLSQLNVSEFHHSRTSIQREFVLFPAGLRNVELAAIVVQIPSIVDPNTVLRSYDSEPLQVGPKGPSLDIRSRLEDGVTIKDQLINGHQSFLSATVILPSGVHSVPSKGEPSSLIERWKSGGSCDCGGWDLDCELRVLRSSKACNSSSGDKLAVFTKVGGEEDQPVLSLSASKDGTYYVEFNSSISELQAFSICIAVLDTIEASVGDCREISI